MQSTLLRFLPVTIVLVAVVVIVGSFWTLGLGSKDARPTASAELSPVEGIRARPTPTAAPTNTVAPNPTPGIVTPSGSLSAPEFRGIVRWLNSEPLEMEAQRGKVVLIDFWTYS